MKSTCFVLLLASIAHAASTFHPARPPAIPLAVRSPYMNTWLSAGSDGGGNGGYLAGEWPTFWKGAITGWAGMIRVDGTVYTWMGKPVGPPLVNQTAFEYTAAKSIFTMNVAGLVEMNVTFLSPITPTGMLRLSLPFSYLDVTLKSLDGGVHDVQLYADVSAEWAAGDRDATVQWDYDVTYAMGAPAPGALISTASLSNTGSMSPTPTATTESAMIFSVPATSTGTLPEPTSSAARNQGLAYHHFYRSQQIIFAEFNEQAEWGDWYWATQNSANMTYQSGADDDVRGGFISSGSLTNINDTEYRAINDRFPVFAFAVDLGAVTTPVSTLFSLSLIQADAIQFEGADGTVNVPGSWTSYFEEALDAVSYFYNDFHDVAVLATEFDAQIVADSMAVGGQNYLTLTSLAARQAFAAIKLCGTINDTLIFLKEISSDGNVNTVDVVFPFHPLLLYSNPELLKMTLDPLFINQESGHWPHTYSIHDLGFHYPNATGHDDGNDEEQPLEECGDMLIMTLAYALRANDTAYLTQHYDILKQWNNYLVEEALVPAEQLSTDDFAGKLANQTNLALKGIIGIGAMARIANLTGHADDATNFSSIATSYMTQWQTLALAPAAGDMPAHTTLSYGNASSFGLLYNLYGDRLLGLDLVPQSVYDTQSAFYPTKLETYGVPLDSRHSYTKGELDWELFAAAVASNETQELLIAAAAKWVNETPTNLPFGDLFDTVTGDYPPSPIFAARPVVGAMFALLALGPSAAT